MEKKRRPIEKNSGASCKVLETPPISVSIRDVDWEGIIRAFFVTLIAILICAPAATEASGSVISVERLLPETVYAENHGYGQRLNFDIELANSSDEAVELQYLELRAFDTDGGFLTRMHIGSNGLPGPIENLPSRIVPPGGTLYLFNPFPEIPVRNAIGRVTVSLFHTAGRTDLEFEPVSVPLPYLRQSPMPGRAYVFSGSDLHSHHRRVSLNSEPARAIGMTRIAQRFALDLTVVDPVSGNLSAHEVSNPEDWLAFGRPIVSPADGRVVAVRSDMADNRIDPDGQRIRPDNYESYGDSASLGNFVLLDIGGAYLVMSHFREGSLSVQPGAQVRSGEPLGELGFSGDTVYPHLHMQLQDGPDILHSNPLPIAFTCVRVGLRPNERDIANGQVDTGMTIGSCAGD